MRRKRAALITLLLLAVLIGGAGLWLRAQRRQYALNRALIDALVKGDDKQALALVNAGADPNTRYKPTPMVSLPELVKQLFHQSPPTTNDSPTALVMACGGIVREDPDRLTFDFDEQANRPDTPRLVEMMLKHGAKVNATGLWSRTSLSWAVMFHRRETVRLLLEYGASPNGDKGEEFSPLMLARQDSLPDIVTLLKQYGARK